MAPDHSLHAAHGVRGSKPGNRGLPTAISSRSAAAPVPALGSDIRLTLPARPENVAVVRHVLGALTEVLVLPRALIDDVRLAVTEACTNVVRHAYYAGEEGSIDVIVRPRGDALEVIVADTGQGAGPSGDTGGPGLGLPLIAALADDVEVERTPRAGRRLCMRFRRSRSAPSLRLA